MNQKNDDYSVTWATFKTLRPLLFVAILVLGWIGVEVWAWVFEDGVPIDAEIRSAMVRNFALIGLGLVGLPLAIWRGWTAHKQADIANRQINALEYNNYAQQLQKGAELLDDERVANVQTGIVTLEAIAVSGSKELARPAADLIAAYLGNKHKDGHLLPDRDILQPITLSVTARDALFRISRAGLTAKVVLNFEAAETHIDEAETAARWFPIRAVKIAGYRGGAFVNLDADFDEATQTFFAGVIFKDCRICRDQQSARCVFANCKFKNVGHDTLNDNKFISCDFSGCLIRDEIKHVGFIKDCFYYEDDPPRLQGGTEFRELSTFPGIEERDPVKRP